jgi:hypothetical protein
LYGFKTWDDWKRLEKEKKLKEVREKKKDDKTQNSNKPKVEIEPTSKDIRESEENVFTY